MSRIHLLYFVVVFVFLFQRGVSQQGNCDSSITDEVSFSATDNLPDYPANDGFLDNPDGAWCSQTVPPDAYLQVDLNDLYEICAVAVQGFVNSSGNFSTTKYMLSISIDGENWFYYRGGGIEPKEIMVPAIDGDSIHEMSITSQKLARGVRFHPTAVNGSATCLRVAVYGKTVVNVNCNERDMTISISNEGLGPDIEEVNMEDPSCSFNVSHNSDTTFFFPVASCGTLLQSTDEYFFFSNTVYGKVSDAKVTQSYDVEYRVNCSYRRTGSASSQFRPNVGFEVKGTEYGTFNVSMNGFKDANFVNEITEEDQPLALETVIYVRLMVVSNDSDLTLHLQECWATADGERNNEERRNLIESGCSNDTSTNYTCNNSTIQDFEMSVFKLDGSLEVYLHCDVVMCLRSQLDSECKLECDSCGSSSSTRKRRSLDENLPTRPTPLYRMTIGPFQVEDPTVTNQEEKELPVDRTSDGLTTPLIAAIAGSVTVAVIAICVAIILVVIILKRRDKAAQKSRHVSTQPSMQSPILNIYDAWQNIWQQDVNT